MKEPSALPGPLLTVYLNTRNVDAFRHPVVAEGLVWFRREAARLLFGIARRLESASSRKWPRHFLWPLCLEGNPSVHQCGSRNPLGHPLGRPVVSPAT